MRIARLHSSVSLVKVSPVYYRVGDGIGLSNQYLDIFA